MPMPFKKREHPECLACGHPFARTDIVIRRFCTNTCQSEYRYQKYIERWLAGLEKGWGTKLARISNHVRRWVLE